MVKVCALQLVHLDSIPSLGLNTPKMLLISLTLDAPHAIDSVEKKPANLIVVSWKGHLIEFLLFVADRWWGQTFLTMQRLIVPENFLAEHEVTCMNEFGVVLNVAYVQLSASSNVASFQICINLCVVDADNTCNDACGTFNKLCRQLRSRKFHMYRLWQNNLQQLTLFMSIFDRNALREFVRNAISCLMTSVRQRN